MPRTRKPYTLYARKLAGNKRPIFYYTINPESGVPKELCESRKSTALETESAAIRFVLRRIEKLKAAGVLHTSNPTLGEFMEPFYDPERCPHMARVGRDRFSPKTSKVYRGLVLNHILGDEIAEARIKDVRPMHLASFRQRLQVKTVSRMVKKKNPKTGKVEKVERRTKLSQATVRKVMDALRVGTKELYLNRYIDSDPGPAVPRRRPKSKERGVFTVAELRKLFSEQPGPFLTVDAWMAFRLAAVFGMRRGEVLALQVKDVHEDHTTIRRAWKSESEMGDPKGGRGRSIVSPRWFNEEVQQYLTGRLHSAPDDLLICHEHTGNRRGQNWWDRNFHHALQAAGIPETDAEGSLRQAHSFRHTINSLLMERGISPLLVGAFLGHSADDGLSKVQRGYTHVQAMDPQAILDALGEIFEGTGGWLRRSHGRKIMLGRDTCSRCDA